MAATTMATVQRVLGRACESAGLAGKSPQSHVESERGIGCRASDCGRELRQTQSPTFSGLRYRRREIESHAPAVACPAHVNTPLGTGLDYCSHAQPPSQAQWISKTKTRAVPDQAPGAERVRPA